MRMLLLSLLAVGCLVGVTGAQDDLATQHQAIQGTWKVTFVIDNGREPPPGILPEIKWVISKDTITQIQKDQKKEIPYAIKGGKQPLWIDLSRKDAEPTKGIFELKGDVLRVAFNEVRNERPTTFQSKPDSFDLLIILEREKP